MNTSEKKPGGLAYEAVPTTYLEQEEERKTDARVQPSAGASGQPLSGRAVMGPWYVPKGSLPRNKGGQAKVYDCFLREGKLPDGVSAVAKLYPLAKNTRARIEKIHEVNRTVMGLNHPHLAKIFADGITEDHKYYMVVMRAYEPYDGFLEFESFGKNKKLFERLFLEEAEGLNDALFALHGQHIFHSDIKPDNIMQYEGTDGKNHLVLIDFGAGVGGERHPEGESSVTATMVTRGYTAPELTNARKAKVSAATDYYSFGFTMAEFVAGRYPRMDEMNDTAEDQAYRGRNMESAYTWYGLLLPQQLPDYLARFFEGTIYSDTDRRERNHNRWGAKQIRTWITYVKEGNHDAARGIRTGLEIAAEQQRGAGFGVQTSGQEAAGGQSGQTEMQRGTARVQKTVAGPQTEVVVKYGQERPVKIHSTEEMAVLFLEHWDETIENLLRNARWSRIFSRFGEDVANLFDQVREEMQADEARKEEIFDQMIMETYLPEEIRERQLRYRNHVFATREEFGRTIYALMLEEKERTGGRYRLPEPAKDGPKDLYQVVTEMFASGTVERFFQNYPDAWGIGAHEMALAKQITEELANENKTFVIVKLYRLSFCMQGSAWLNRDGRDFEENRNFLAWLKELYETDLNKALRIQQECYTEDGKLRVDYYAFLMEAKDTVKRPKAAMCEKLM